MKHILEGDATELKRGFERTINFFVGFLLLFGEKGTGSPLVFRGKIWPFSDPLKYLHRSIRLVPINARYALELMKRQG